MCKTYIKPQISWTEDKVNLLIEKYPIEGSKQLSKLLGISTNAVKAMARRLNIKCLKNKNLYKLKPLLEETNEVYYWLGFIMSDGYISPGGELKFILSVEDLEHLEKLSKLLNVNLIIKDRTCHLSCKDVKYGILLRNKMNIQGKKTYEPPLLNFLDSKEKFLSFLAGFIDGDGMIGYRNNNPYLLRIMIHGSWFNNLNYIKERLLEYFDFSITVSYTKKGYSYLSLSTSKDILKLKEEFIKLQLPILKRKWIKNLT